MVLVSTVPTRPPSSTHTSYFYNACIRHKVDRYLTSQGVLSLEELNRRTKAFVPRLASEEFRYLDDAWLKYHHETPLAQELYRLDQAGSRRLQGKGAGLNRDDVERLARSR